MPNLIDADKLKSYFAPTLTGRTEYSADEILLTIVSMPTVDAEPVRHGRWKPMDLTYGRSIYYCTNCGESAEVPTDMGKPIYMFCPNCGAKMDGEGEDAD